MTNRTLLLIPHYNSLDSLYATLESVEAAEQLDLLVVDDGSNQPPEMQRLQQSFVAKGKIMLQLLPENQGITAALNAGLQRAYQGGYRYIARLDAGDENIGCRFKLQEDFLDDNPQVGVVGSWVDFVDEQGDDLFTLKHPCDNPTIQKAIYRYNPFVHPAVMVRLAALKQVGGYPEAYPSLEDWACFLKIGQFFELANLPQVLIRYTVSSNSISSRKRHQQSCSKCRLLRDNYRCNFNQTKGLLKNLLLLAIPREVSTRVKKVIFR